MSSGPLSATTRGAMVEDPPSGGATVLVIEDEAAIQRVVRLYLEQAGYRVLAATDGQAGIAVLAREHADLVVLDLMLPILDGWEVCRRIRLESRIPILILTARHTEDDRVHGLDLGADDYITKPFSPRELVSRVRAILRRAPPADGMAASPERITFPGLTIVPTARRVEVDGRTVALTAKEFDLLLTFARSPDCVFSREELFSRVWGFDYLGDSRTVDVHVGTLRKKLDECEPGSARFIKTVWRVGYKLEVGVDAGEATS